MKFNRLKTLSLVALIAASVSCDFALSANETPCPHCRPRPLPDQEQIDPTSPSIENTLEFSKTRVRRHARPIRHQGSRQ